MAPELFNPKAQYDNRVDVYSLGKMINEIYD